MNDGTFFSNEQTVNAAVLLQITFDGIAIGEIPDKNGYDLRVSNSSYCSINSAHSRCLSNKAARMVSDSSPGLRMADAP